MPEEKQLDRVLDTLVPEWDTLPPENPPGNILASKLRNIMDDSKSIFGKSRYSTETAKHNRWKSRVQSDYVNLTPRGEENGRAITAPEGARRDKMFMNWKVPERVTTGDPSRCNSRVRTSADVNNRNNEIPHAAPPMSANKLPLIEIQTPRSARAAPSAVPATPRLQTSAGRLSAQPRTAEGSPRHAQLSRPASIRSSAPEPFRPASNVSKPMSSRKPKSFKISQLLSRYYTPSGSPEEWLASASDSDRQMIEKALRMVDREQMSKLDTTRSLEKWLQGASDRDRAVALKFFGSLAKEPLQGASEQKIQLIVKTLQQGRQFPGTVQRPSTEEQQHKFRYLRLLSPETRAQKWMYQSWHHLPPARDDNPVINRTSIYTEPNKYMPRHYVIHPDLG